MHTPAEGAHNTQRGRFFSPARIIVRLIAFLALAAGLACLVGSSIRYSELYGFLQHQFGSALTAKHLSPRIYAQKQLGFRILGVSFGVLSALIYFVRHVFTAYVADELNYLHRDWYRLRKRVAGAVGQTERIVAVEVLFVTIVGLVLRLFSLFQPLRFDEAVSYLDYASKPPYLILSLYVAPVNHVFHTLLVHFAAETFGGQVWVIRLPALIAGTMMIPLTAYYYLRKSNAKLDEVRVIPVLEQDGHHVALDSGRSERPAWVYVDSSQGDSLSSVLNTHDFDTITIVSRILLKSGARALSKAPKVGPGGPPI